MQAQLRNGMLALKRHGQRAIQICFVVIFYTARFNSRSGDEASSTTIVWFSLVFSWGIQVGLSFNNDVSIFVNTEIAKAESPFAAISVVTDSLIIADSKF